ncbi:MAG: protein kinase [Phycisphaerales bacterium JB039]
MQIQRGTQIGPYIIDREIGRGGMGVVYFAHDGRLDRPVAIKALPEHFEADADRLARFEREARSLAQLNHPNVAGIYGVEEQDGQKFLVLEYVEGPTLADRLDAGPLPVDEAIEIAIEIAAGVEAAHEAGVIHRDLKPANIKLTPDGKVKVLDFGLAKASDATTSTGMPDVTTARSPTIPGAILGTAAYMSPEQARGRRVDRRTDVWSFGAVLYEALTGASPFAGESAQDSIGAVLHKDVDLSRLPPATPEAVRRLLRRCLQRDKSARLRDIGDARLELLEARDGGPAGTVAPATRRSWLAWSGWVAAAAAVVGLALLALTAQEAPAPLVRSSLVAPEGVALYHVIISPDGQRIAAAGFPERPGGLGERPVDRLYVRELDSDQMVPVDRSEGVVEAAFSPDGRVLAFAARGADSSSVMRLYRMPADLSAPPVEIMTVPRSMIGDQSGAFCWTAAGAIAMISRATQELVLIDPGSGQETRRVAISFDRPQADIGTPTAPFGARHVTVNAPAYEADFIRFDVCVIDIETGEAHTLIENADHARLTPSGDLLFARGDAIYRTEFDAQSMRPRGAFRPVQTGVRTFEVWLHGDYALSDNGTLAYLPGGLQGAARQIVMVDQQGVEIPWSDERRAFSDDGLAISLDGERMAVIIPAPGGLYELWGSEVAQPRLRRLLTAPGTDYFEPCFTRDGEHIIVARWDPAAEEPGSLLLVPFEGGEARRIWGGWGRTEWVIPVAMWPDDTRVMVWHGTPGGVKLLEIAIDGHGEARTLLEQRMMYSPDISPQERSESAPLLVYVSDETGRPEAYVRILGDEGLGPAIPATSRGAWSTSWILRDDVLYLRYTDLEWREWIAPVETTGWRIRIGAAERTERTADDRYEEVARTIDGRMIAVVRGEGEAPATRVELVQGWGQLIAK